MPGTLSILEIGCGEHPAAHTTIRLDARPLPHVDIVGDGANLPFPDNYLDGIYARHVIEHWSHRQTQTILTEWLRVIKPGGYLELHCPDMDKLIKHYQHAHKDEYTGLEFTADLLSYYLFGGQDYPENFHCAGFTFLSLREKLLSLGVVKVVRLHQDEDSLELRLKGYKG